MKKIVQVKNPRTNLYIKIDTERAVILSSKKSNGPYNGIQIIKKRNIKTNKNLINS